MEFLLTWIEIPKRDYDQVESPQHQIAPPTLIFDRLYLFCSSPRGFCQKHLWEGNGLKQITSPLGDRWLTNPWVGLDYYDHGQFRSENLSATHKMLNMAWHQLETFQIGQAEQPELEGFICSSHPKNPLTSRMKKSMWIKYNIKMVC